MRKHWDIPNESNFSFTRKDWLKNLLYKLDTKQRSQTLMLLWHSWHLRNDVVHDKGEETVARSVAFLMGYDKLLNEDNNDQVNKLYHDFSKPETEALCHNAFSNRATKKDNPSWIPPERDKLKMNVDAGFTYSMGEATAGFAFGIIMARWSWPEALSYRIERTRRKLKLLQFGRGSTLLTSTT
jgi:hypothetical protein